MRWIPLGCRILAVLLSLAGTSRARTIIVRPDGSGDCPDLQSAIAHAGGGDVIELSNGIFAGSGNRNLAISGKAITIRSQSGDPASCTIDCQSQGEAISFESTSGESGLQGITITRGLARSGGALFAGPDASPQITNCVFFRNSATLNSGAVNTLGSPTFTNCQFIENSAGESAGALGGGSGVAPAVASLNHCLFLGNSAPWGGGAVAIESTGPSRSAILLNCTFAQNICSQWQGGAVIFAAADCLVDHCTFVYNSAAGGAVYSEGSTVISNSIIAFSHRGVAVDGEDGSAVLSCCDLFGNAGGDWTGGLAAQAAQDGNFSADPLFCEPTHLDFSLQLQSPCAPPHDPSCGIVGAWPVACNGPVPVLLRNWGSIKWSYR